MTQHRLEPTRGNTGPLSKSSSGYFEQEKYQDERHFFSSKPDLYKRQFSDDGHSDRSARSNKSLGRPLSSLENESQVDWSLHRYGNTDPVGGLLTDKTRSIGSDATSGIFLLLLNVQISIR